MSTNKPLRVVVSGFFNPFHAAHLGLLKEAARYGELTVIVNNDKQVLLKGSCPFQTEGERFAIIDALKCVSYTVLAKETDRTTVEETIRDIKPDLLMKGGDRTEDTMADAEREICEQIGCRILYGVGGWNKDNSSSLLIEKAAHWYNAKHMNDIINNTIKFNFDNCMLPHFFANNYINFQHLKNF